MSLYSHLPIDDHQHPLIIGKISTYATSARASCCLAEGRVRLARPATSVMTLRHSMRRSAR
jgi:hypothetical protein